MTVQGSGGSATATITIPTHQAGDMIWIFAMSLTSTAPTAPAAGGTVPTWTVAQSAAANTVGLTSAWALATAANHTSGTWTGMSNMCVLVLRPASGKALAAGASATGNGNNTQTIIYPALTLTTIAGTSFGVRCGTRGTAVLAVGTAPTNWTNQIAQPTGSSALEAVHTRAALVANPTADTVTVTSSNAAYRAHTLEVTELTIPPPIGGALIVRQAIRRAAAH